MAFRFKLGEPFDEGVRRIADEQIERAQNLLKEPGDHAVTIHETRKSLKRLRALLRLVRPAMGEAAFRDENAKLRDIGLSLSGARDRHVLLETLNKLEASTGFGRRGLAESLRHAIGAANGAGAPLTMHQAYDCLVDARKRLAKLQLSGSGFEVVGAGLERSYRRARRAFAEAYEKPSDEAFHEWRKGAQAHWRQMTLLARAWPDNLGARALEARTLSQVLGDDHDLALLGAFARSDVSGLTEEQVALVEKSVSRRQSELRATARPRGERLFAPSPKQLRRAISTYWSAATAIKDQEKAADEEAQPAPGKRVRRQGGSQRRAISPGKV